jgi:hypothetical protein
LRINGRPYRRIEICRHYEEKHGDYLNDDLILELVDRLDGIYFDADSKKKMGRKILTYFAADVDHEESTYRLVWRVIHGRFKLLVVNCY